MNTIKTMSWAAPLTTLLTIRPQLQYKPICPQAASARPRSVIWFIAAILFRPERTVSSALASWMAVHLASPPMRAWS